MLIQEKMNAMVLESPGEPLVYKRVPIPSPSEDQVLVNVIACGVCRTDLHIVDDELKNPKLPLIPGHEIVGRIVEVGKNVTKLKIGDWVGIPWLGYTCGTCNYCMKGEENLCEHAKFTGYTMDGGYAEYTVAFQQYCFILPDMYANASGAPLLCAGLIGYRSYSKIGKNVEKLGIYGFGAAAHILIQLSIYEGKKVYAFTKEGDVASQKFAFDQGAVWAGNSFQLPPEKLDAAIIFAPVGDLIPQALKAVDKGGTVVCGGIYMSAIPSFTYDLLWEERTICSVANLTRNDGIKFLELAAKIPVRTESHIYRLAEANKALANLRKGSIRGAAVLIMDLGGAATK